MSVADKLQTIAENEQKIYDKGKQDEYDRFWDEFQQNGNRTDYYYGFTGGGWTVETLKPKYLIKPSSTSWCAENLFRLANRLATKDKVIDYRTIKDKIDLSNVTSLLCAFYSARINYIDLDIPNCKSLQACFSQEWNATYCTDIKLKITEKCTNYEGTFAFCGSLENLTFVEGSVIAANISISPATKLVKESITSIINALSSSTTGKTCKLSEKAVNKAFETSNGIDDGRVAVEWLNLVDTKPNWTISLV